MKKEAPSIERINSKIFKIEHKSVAMFPPDFRIDRDIYKENPSFNCYAYTMQFTIPVERGSGYYRPGFLVGMAPSGIYDTKTVLIRGFLGDCDYLGLNVEKTTMNAPINESSYKVIMWHSDCRFDTFHFARQNKDGKWSNLIAWGGELECGNGINDDFFREEGFFEKEVYSISRK